MVKNVDSYRFLDPITKRIVKNWIKLESPREIPWTGLPKPLSECTVALLSTGGIALKTDRPFDQEGERQDPWWGDSSFRVIPWDAKTDDIRVYHLHIDPSLGEEDMNCLLPLERLSGLAELGEVGSSASSHYSFMGYLIEPAELLEKSVPAIVKRLRTDQVDVVVMVPA